MIIIAIIIVTTTIIIIIITTIIIIIIIINFYSAISQWSNGALQSYLQIILKTTNEQIKIN